VMEQIGLNHHPRRRPNGITKADRSASKSDDLLKRGFQSDKPLEKFVTDITEIKAKDGKLYVSAIFDCFDLTVLGLAMDTNMKAQLCVHTLILASSSRMRRMVCCSSRDLAGILEPMEHLAASRIPTAIFLP